MQTPPGCFWTNSDLFLCLGGRHSLCFHNQSIIKLLGRNIRKDEAPHGRRNKDFFRKAVQIVQIYGCTLQLI